MQKVISLIIPAYNMELLLPRAVESVLVPTHSDDVEILIVNDGSTDHTLDIARRYEDEHTGNVVVIDKENGNYGSCINAALRVAKGKYVKILDADDYYDTANFDLVVGEMKNLDVDLVVTRFVTVDANGNKGRPRNIHLPPGQTVRLADYVADRSVQGLWMHEIAYRRENLIRMGYHQREGISYTDVQWGFSPMATVKTLYYIDKLVYMYFVGREGQSVSAETYRRRFAQEFECTEAMLDDYVRVRSDSSDIAAMMAAKMEGRIAALYKRALVNLGDFSNEAMVGFDEKVRQTVPRIHRQLGRRWLSFPLFPIRYIHLWRKDRDGWLLRQSVMLFRKYLALSSMCSHR